MWAVVTLLHFLDFRQPIVPSTQKTKIPPTQNRTIDLRMSCFTSVLRSTNWAVGRYRGVLSDRFVWWSDSVWSIHVSSQQSSCLLCASRFFLSNTSCFLVSYIFLSWKVCFRSHEFDSGPTDVFLYYSPPLYQLSYRQLYRLSVW